MKVLQKISGARLARIGLGDVLPHVVSMCHILQNHRITSNVSTSDLGHQVSLTDITLIRPPQPSGKLMHGVSMHEQSMGIIQQYSYAAADAQQVVVGRIVQAVAALKTKWRGRYIKHVG